MKSTRNFHARRADRAPRFGFRRVAAALLLAALAASGACSLLVESTTDQCKTSQDCSEFGAFSVCSAGICVKPAPIGDAGADASDASDGDSGSDASDDGGSCFTGVPTTDLEYLNQCTDGVCEPFDNCVRLGLCGSATLPPLVAPGDGGL